ncbi:DUF397 domain-containing protein [Actinacidiphila epipremni]|uniref:DUF397 domain-containing protein n=1 Tax=Actinacidiphila epipremni TaxID=2053013 RepID=UPI0019D1E8A8|nr:DUF397 domain-containing protein [Actinacidiphila epipremni]
MASSHKYQAGGLTGGQDLAGARDSTDPRGPGLRFAPAEWRAFVASVRAGAFGTF